MSAFSYPDICQGETAIEIEFSRTYADASRAAFASGTIEVLDEDGVVLPGFDPAVSATVSADTYSLSFRLAGWGIGAGYVPTIDAEAQRYVKWYGVDTDGEAVVSKQRIPWLHKPQRA